MISHPDTATLAKMVQLDSIRIGSTPTTPLDAIVAELPAPIDGILGISIFGQHKLLVSGNDLEARYISDSDEFNYPNLRFPMSSWTSVGITWDSRLPAVRVSLNGNGVTLLLDTGLSTTTISSNVAS